MRTRNITEWCFGILKSRFRCLDKSGGTLLYSVEKAQHLHTPGRYTSGKSCRSTRPRGARAKCWKCVDVGLSHWHWCIWSHLLINSTETGRAYGKGKVEGAGNQKMASSDKFMSRWQRMVMKVLKQTVSVQQSCRKKRPCCQLINFDVTPICTSTSQLSFLRPYMKIRAMIDKAPKSNKRVKVYIFPLFTVFSEAR